MIVGFLDRCREVPRARERAHRAPRRRRGGDIL